MLQPYYEMQLINVHSIPYKDKAKRNVEKPCFKKKKRKEKKVFKPVAMILEFSVRYIQFLWIIFELFLYFGWIQPVTNSVD